MSLADAVKEIADDMATESMVDSNNYSGETRSILRSYAKQLRMALKAVEGQQQLQGTVIPSRPDIQAIADEQAREFLRKHEERLKQQAAELRREDGAGLSVTYFVGGSMDGTYVQTDPRMPVGAKTMLAEQVYQLQADGQMHYQEEETRKLKGEDK